MWGYSGMKKVRRLALAVLGMQMASSKQGNGTRMMRMEGRGVGGTAV